MREHHRSDDPDLIERDLEQTRKRMDRTLDEIQGRLSPGQLLDEGLSYFGNGKSEYLSTFGRNLATSTRDNPLPVMMIGLGVLWLTMGQRQPDAGTGKSAPERSAGRNGAAPNGDDDVAKRARAAGAGLRQETDETMQAFEHRRQQAMARVLDLKEQADETAEDLQARVAQAMEGASARWDEMKEGARSRAHDLRDGAAQVTHDVRDGAAQGMAHARNAVDAVSARAGRTSDKALEIFEQQPLLAAAAGVTLGAVLGSLLPATRQEAEFLGPHRDALLREGKAAARDLADTAGQTGRAAANAALDEVDHAMEAPDRSVDAHDAEPSSDGDRAQGRPMLDPRLPG